MKKKILFIGPHRPNRNGSQRFRMEQYFPHLQKLGYDIHYSWFIDLKDDRIFYSPGQLPGKLGVLVKAIYVRLGDVFARNRYDVIFIQREAFMTGTVFFERLLSHSKAKLVFDFDDAIWLEDVSLQNRKLKWLKRPAKTADIISLADEVIAGNNFLADYARQYSNHVHIIPTVVDTDVFAPAHRIDNGATPVCIGWSGSKTTVKHFQRIVPVLKVIRERFGDRVRFKQVGDQNFSTDDLTIESSDFSFDRELADFHAMDIGLMPLPDDIWSKGKCAFKAIQYMALEIPPVVSPVGMNTEVVKHGVNGFLAPEPDDWVKCLSELIESRALCRQVGIAARKSVIDNYSVKAQLNNFLAVIK